MPVPTQTWNRNIDKTELKPKSVHQAVETTLYSKD